jgi:hypothetical protein
VGADARGEPSAQGSSVGVVVGATGLLTVGALSQRAPAHRSTGRLLGAEPMAERTLREVAHAGTWAEQRAAFSCHASASSRLDVVKVGNHR